MRENLDDEKAMKRDVSADDDVVMMKTMIMVVIETSRPAVS